MADRKDELSKLQSFIEKTDTELTMIFQHLQWDRKLLLEGKPLLCCKYDENHKIPAEAKDNHERKCLLSKLGYSKDDVMLSEHLETNDSTVIKFSKLDMKKIIDKAANADTTFRRGVSSTQESEGELELVALDRLRATQTPDERRALYDAVVAATSFCHDLSDLALPSDNGEASSSTRQKSRVEILSELRDMRRRRAKYRVAAKTRNYSDVLRDVIKTQMEFFADVKVEEVSQPSSSSRRSEQFTRTEDEHYSSKYPKHTPIQDRGKNVYESKDIYTDRKSHKRDESSGRYHEDQSSSKRRRMNDFVQYPDPRQYKQDRYKKYENSPKKSATYYNPGPNRRYNSDQQDKQETLDRQSHSKSRFIEVKQEPDTDIDDHRKRKYKEESDRHSSKHRNKYDEKDYSRERYYGERSKDRRYGDDSSGKSDRKTKDKYAKDRRADSKHSRDSKEDKYKVKNLCDNFVL